MSKKWSLTISWKYLLAFALNTVYFDYVLVNISLCRMCLQYEDCIPLQRDKHYPKGVSLTWHKTTADGDAPVQEIWVIFHYHYSQVHSDLEW